MNYHFSGEEDVSSPGLIYYRDIIEENTDKAIELAGGAERLWPHMKTHKTEALLKLQIERGIRRFKCATIAEGELCAEAGAAHVLVAYPLVGPAGCQNNKGLSGKCGLIGPKVRVRGYFPNSLSVFSVLVKRYFFSL